MKSQGHSIGVPGGFRSTKRSQRCLRWSQGCIRRFDEVPVVSREQFKESQRIPWDFRGLKRHFREISRMFSRASQGARGFRDSRGDYRNLRGFQGTSKECLGRFNLRSISGGFRGVPSDLRGISKGAMRSQRRLRGSQGHFTGSQWRFREGVLGDSWRSLENGPFQPLKPHETPQRPSGASLKPPEPPETH